MNVGSLFSGIGGLDLGLERAGMRVIWQAEVDPYASRVLAHHWPDVPNLGDVTAVDWDLVERPDLVCGGFPCQPVSQSGYRRAQLDERWMWPAFARCLRHVRPDRVLVENVPGLLVRGMGDVLGDLAEIGYDAEWDCLPAAAFGAPHRRDRVFVVAHRQGVALEEPVLLQAGRSNGQSRGGARRALSAPGWATDQPSMVGVVHGVPHRMDRFRTLGNAVVPQVAEWIGRRIMSAHSECSFAPDEGAP